MHAPKLSGNVTNLDDEKGVSTAVVTRAPGGYRASPLAPHMLFVTVGANLRLSRELLTFWVLVVFSSGTHR